MALTPQYTKFTQLPNADPGAGTFSTADGLTYDAYLPDVAQQLAQNDQQSSATDLVSKPDVGPNLSVPEPNQIPLTPPEAIPTPKPKITVDEALQRAYRAEGGGVNPTTGAYGPIQLMPSNLKAVATKLGITEDDIKKMSPEEYKKEVVPAYFSVIGHPLDKIDPNDVYMGIAAPGFIGKPNDTPIQDRDFGAWKVGSEPWGQNPGWAKIAQAHGRDYITAGDLRQYGGIEGDAAQGAAQGGPARQPLSPEDQSTAELANRLSAPNVSGGQISQTMVQGNPLTPEEDANLTARSADISKKTDLQKGAVQNILDEQKILQDQRAAELKQQKDAQQQAEKDGRDIYDRRQTDIQSALKDIQDSKAPPPFGGNTFAGILAIIGQALGAYGASITKTRNFAADLVNSSLDRDQKAWEQEMMNKKFRVSSLEKLSDSARTDLREAKTDRELTQRLMYDNELKNLQTKQWGTEQQRAIDSLDDNNQKHIDDLRFEAQRQARDRVSTTQVAASSSPPSVEDINKRAKAELEGGKTPEQIAKAKGLIGEETQIPVSDKERDEYTKDAENRGGRPTLDTAERTILQLAPQLGMSYDAKTGKLVDVDGKDHVPRYIGGSVKQSPFWATVTLSGDEESRKSMLALASAAALSAKALNGTRASDKEFDRALERVSGTSKESQIAGLNAQLEEIRQKRNDLNTAFPGAAADFDKRNAAGQKTLPPRFTPITAAPENPTDALRP